jgi:hypothetical protein
MSGAAPPPRPTNEEVVEIVRRVVCRSDFYARGRCQKYFRMLNYPLEAVIDLLAECTTDELVKHELDYDYPDRPYYIAEFDVHDDAEPLPFYIKVALLLPDMESGYLLSFHLRQ